MNQDLKRVYQGWVEQHGSDKAAQEWLHSVVYRFYEAMAKDTMLVHFFIGRDLKQIATHQTQFLLHAAGALKDYSGKNPNRAHASLPPIFAGHFDRRGVVLRQCLEKEGVDPDSIEIWIRFERSFRDAILTESGPRTP